MTRFSLLAVLLLVGCAAKRIDLSKARLAIPVPCIDRILGGVTDQAYCETITGESADVAKCHELVVHFTCLKVKAK